MADQFTFEEMDLIQVKGAWERALKILSADVSSAVHTRFLKPLTVLSFESGVVVFSAPGAFIVEWVRERFYDRLTQALGDELGQEVRVEVRARTREKPAAEETVMHAVVAARSDAADCFRPDDRFKFSTFVVGQSNRYAVAGCRAVASEPGAKYNPLFIYGGPGLGKTHMLHAIAHELQVNHPKLDISYKTAQEFTEQFVVAMQSNKIDHFRRAQRNTSIWLIDDIQFVAGKDKTSEEIFHTFNTLQQMGKQIVICADRPPRELYGMDERLKSRFEAGLVVDVQAPDTETKGAILLMRAKQDGIPLTPEIALLLAASVPGNVRTLLGALNRVVALASVEKAEINVPFVEEIIEKYHTTSGQEKPAFQSIVHAVGDYYKIATTEIVGASRKAPIAHARHVAVYLTREITHDSWKHIGHLFGDRDHTSVMHAHEKISELMVRDKDLSAAVEALLRNLNR